MHLADVERTFGNKASWDKSFENCFIVFAQEGNQVVFDNDQSNYALKNVDALDVSDQFDLVYIDTPYISRKGIAVDYDAFYHFREGLTMYDDWGHNIDQDTKHRR